MKARWSRFQSPLADGIPAYLQVKRALGRKFANEERSLRLLDSFLVVNISEIKEITPELLDSFLSSRARPRPRSFNHLLGVVRRLMEWLVVQGLLPVSPLRAKPRRESSRRIPFLFEPNQARQLLQAARALPDRPRGPQRGPIYHVVFALLYGLGMRVGEVCRLLFSDVDLERQVLVVRHTKFDKTRLIPFGPRMAALLREHIDRQTDGAGGTRDPQAPLFTFDRRRNINPTTVTQTFLSLTRRMPIRIPTGTSPPRLHDLRHSFAVGTLLRWYREGKDPASRLQTLSTFLGHVDSVSTAVYLTITQDLLRLASSKFETLSCRNWEVEL